MYKWLEIIDGSREICLLLDAWKRYHIGEEREEGLKIDQSILPKSVRIEENPNVIIIKKINKIIIS